MDEKELNKRGFKTVSVSEFLDLTPEDEAIIEQQLETDQIKREIRSQTMSFVQWLSRFMRAAKNRGNLIFITPTDDDGLKIGVFDASGAGSTLTFDKNGEFVNDGTWEIIE